MEISALHDADRLDYRRIDGDFRELLAGLDEGAVISRETLFEARALNAAMRVPLESERVDFEERRVSAGDHDVPVWMMRPRHRASAPAPAIVWLHGGGFIMGSPHDRNALALAEDVGCVVASVDYRLAPEQPFPAALHDAAAVLEWLHRDASELGIDAGRIALGGVSAGGGLAAGLALFQRDRAGTAPVHLHLVAPMLDHRHDTASGRITNHPVWNRSTSLNAWEMYLGGRSEPGPTGHASPSTAADVSRLPPTWIGVGSEDLFRDEDAEFARRLNAAGSECAFEVFPGLFHGASTLLPDADMSRRMRQAGSHALRTALLV